MKRSDIIAKLGELHPKLGIDNIKMILNQLVDSMSVALIDNKRIEVRGFGSFTTKVHERMTTRNPRNNKVIILSVPSRSVYFRPGKELGLKVNNGLANVMTGL